MNAFLNELPAILIFGALVAVFVSLYRHEPTPRMRFWIAGWAVIFLHLVADGSNVRNPFLAWFLQTIHFSTLQIAGAVFLVSITNLIHRPKLRRLAIAFMATPSLIYVGLWVAGVQARPLYYLLVIWMSFGAGVWFIFWWHKLSLYIVSTLILICLVGLVGLHFVAVDQLDRAFFASLLLTYGWCVCFFARSYWRRTPGVILTCVGFSFWAAVWALAAFAPSIVSHVGNDSQLWDVPKLFVAFGMILTVLENESLNAQAGSERERQLNIQMARFAEITSRLLSGVDVRSFCTEIAQVIHEATTFRRVAIVLTDETDHLYLAGFSGLSASARDQFESSLQGKHSDSIAEYFTRGLKIGNFSYHCTVASIEGLSQTRSTEQFDPNPFWQNGDELVVMLRSAQGTLVGCISLDDPTDVTRVTAEEMSQIEVLAGDLAVALENASLQRRIVLREKMASVGQLVSGVAHELNNPLTVVLGYSELMADADTGQRFQREISTIRREAHRMKVIIDNLLRFARQAKTETLSANLEGIVDEAVTLRDYEFTRMGITFLRDMPPDLPWVQVDEAQLKIVIVNLLSNAAEAVQNCHEKSITLYARRIGERIVFSVLDTGNGFADLQRVFDPFFTTKAPGRGPGLGLSICYGIVKQHAGEIYARNVVPKGACITLELPIATKAKTAAK